jgi:hypothetical protein
MIRQNEIFIQVLDANGAPAPAAAPSTAAAKAAAPVH